jgi:glucosamine--fructose-6-phosphate aminotransferase (isomerizing)
VQGAAAAQLPRRLLALEPRRRRCRPPPQIIDELGQLPGKVRSALLLDSAMQELAQQLRDTQSLLFFGRGYNYATALEAALKVGGLGLAGGRGEIALAGAAAVSSWCSWCRCWHWPCSQPCPQPACLPAPPLQMKELALIHSEGILAGEMKHGPLALVDEHLPIIVIATRWECVFALGGGAWAGRAACLLEQRRRS